MPNIENGSNITSTQGTHHVPHPHRKSQCTVYGMSRLSVHHLPDKLIIRNHFMTMIQHLIVRLAIVDRLADRSALHLVTMVIFNFNRPLASKMMSPMDNYSYICSPHFIGCFHLPCLSLTCSFFWHFIFKFFLNCFIFGNCIWAAIHTYRSTPKFGMKTSTLPSNIGYRNGYSSVSQQQQKCGKFANEMRKKEFLWLWF